MCGRCLIYTLEEVEFLVATIKLDFVANPWPDWPARPLKVQEAYPGSLVPLITLGSGAAGEGDAADGGNTSRGELNFETQVLRWGFSVDWKKTPIFNTRLESVQRGFWKESMEQRRCLIPVQAFYENSTEILGVSPRTGKPRAMPFKFASPTQAPLFIGGIWNEDCFSMVTTEPNNAVAPVHPRMPLVIEPAEIPVWFGMEYRSLANRSNVELAKQPELDLAPIQEPLFRKD